MVSPELGLTSLHNLHKGLLGLVPSAWLQRVDAWLLMLIRVLGLSARGNRRNIKSTHEHLPKPSFRVDFLAIASVRCPNVRVGGLIPG